MFSRIFGVHVTFLVISYFIAVAFGEDFDWNAVTNAAYKTQPAKAAVKKYNERLSFLNDKLSEHTKQAQSDLKAELISATQKAIADGQLAEVQLISSMFSSSEVHNQDHKKTPEAPITDNKTKEIKVDARRLYAGYWAGTWGTTGMPLAFAIDDNGEKLTIHHGRVLMLNQQYEQLELILRGNQLVVLGWSSDKKLDPFKHQPNHVAILDRVLNVSENSRRRKKP